MAWKAMLMLALMAMHVMSCTAIQYLFTSADYSLEEDGSTHTDVILQRTGDTPGDTSETTTTTSIALNTECPADCPNMSGANLAVEGSSADYTINTQTLTFAPNVLSLSVSITIHDDDDEEPREYFCLSVADSDARGSVWYTRIVIPWNDNCVNHLSDLDGGGGAAPDASPGFLIQDFLTGPFGYIGPWENTDTPITISVEPETSGDAGDGKDLNIFLSNIANTQSGSFVWYGIHIDDSESNDPNHANTGSADDTILVEGADGEDVGNTLIGSVATNLDLIEADTITTLELSYDNGVVRLDRTSPSPTATFTETNGSPLDINHLFVSAADDKFATWEICAMEPKKLKPVGAKASGQRSKFGPEKAIDDVIWDTSCFFSEPDSNGDNWLQIDLGREFDVRTIVILPVPGTVSATLDPATLHNARVYVGSCRVDDITSNHVCDGDIGIVSNLPTGQHSLIEVDCPSGTYGRYVYILPDSDSTEFVLCDVFVYGDDVPIDEETRVYFTTDESEVDEDVASGEVTLQLTRTGDGRTCTYVDYYTDPSDGDFTEILPGNAKTIKISGSGNSQSDTVTIDITDDDDCEPEEEFKVYLTNAEGGLLGTQCSTTVEIDDDDAVEHDISTTTPTIGESNGPLVISVERTGDGTSQDGSAVLKFQDGDATSEDYDNTEQGILFDSGSNNPTAEVPIHDDECYEEDETFHVDIDNFEPSTCSKVAAGLPLEITITDDDSHFEWDFDTDDVLILEEDSGSRTISIEREGTSQSKTVDFDIYLSDLDNAAESDDFSIIPSGGSVTFNTNDGSEGVTITVNDDSEVEEDEWFTLTLSDPLDPDGDCPENIGDDYKLTVIIRNNDGFYEWESSSYDALESDGQVEVCVHRNGDLTIPRTLQVTTTPVGGTGATGSDIGTATQIVFQAGQSRSCGLVGITPDTIDESDETFTLTFTGPSGVNFGERDTATLTVHDDDDEGVQSTASTATPGSDFTPISLSEFTIPAQTASYPVQLQLIDDDDDEPAESFILTLSVISPSSATVTLSQTTITILDNDPTPTTPPPPAPGLSDAAIAGVVIGAVVGALVLAIIAGVLFWLWIRGRTGSTPKPPSAIQQAQGQFQGQLPLVPLGYGNNAFGAAPGNSLYGYDNQFGNSLNNQNQFGVGFI